MNKVWLSIKFLLAAIVIFAFTQGAWSLVLSLNLMTTPRLPWFVVIIGLILVLLWKYLNGDLWTKSNAVSSRREYLRAKAVPRRIFLLAMIAGAISIGTLAALWIILAETFQLPVNTTLRNIPNTSHITIILALIVGALVSALAEEFAFRGYLQSSLEKSYGGLTAILLQAIVLLPLHAATQSFTWQVIGWYFLADIMFGTMAYLTHSIWPGIIVHAAGLLLFFTAIWPHKFSGQPTILTVAAVLILFFSTICVFIKLSKVGASLPTDTTA